MAARAFLTLNSPGKFNTIGNWPSGVWAVNRAEWRFVSISEAHTEAVFASPKVITPGAGFMIVQMLMRNIREYRGFELDAPGTVLIEGLARAFQDRKLCPRADHL